MKIKTTLAKQSLEPELIDRENKFMKFVNSHKQLTGMMIAKHLDITDRAGYERLRQLERCGILKSELLTMNKPNNHNKIRVFEKT